MQLHDKINFLLHARGEAVKANHIFPEFAACEVALESAWGTSELALKANNLFGTKCPHSAIIPTAVPAGSVVAPRSSILLPTMEEVHGHRIATLGHFLCFPDWHSCFRARMVLLERLRDVVGLECYGAALDARDGETFVTEVSKKWSTDHLRASKVLDIYDDTSACFK